jgi:cleavage and polyadenylation specificity factor subunit 2
MELLKILVHALPSATEALIESCGNIRAMTKDIFAPAAGESIQIGQQTNSFSISLSDALLSSLTMSRVSYFRLHSVSDIISFLLIKIQFEDNEVGFIAGRVMAHSNSIIPTLEPLGSKANMPKTDLYPTIARKKDNATLGSRPPIALPHSTMIGDLKLTVLKTRLAAVGVQAELIGEGVLICGAGATKRGGAASVDDASASLGESVAVRKTTKGKVELEGNVSDIYYTVRREIYKLHALVSA